jgi:hypothetical protein
VVETEVASPVLPVMLAKTEFAETCAKLEKGKSPVTSLARFTDSQVATPAPLRERTNWLVQLVPVYSETTPEASVTGIAVVMLEMTRAEVEARVVTARRVVVALVPVALMKVKFCSVDDASERRPPVK